MAEVRESERSSANAIKSLDGMFLYTLTYKRGSQAVHHGLVVAPDLNSAERFGRKWCNNQINCRYILTEEAIIAGPWTMTEDEVPEPEVIPTRAPAPVPVAPAAAIPDRKK